MIIGPVESPRPRRAPARTWFTLLNRRKNTFWRRKSVPKRMTSGSGVKSPTAGGAKIQRATARPKFSMRVITTDVTVPSLARFTFWAPMFCETKVVEAMAML